jgi:type II secretory pathway pseudopilin PulG
MSSGAILVGLIVTLVVAAVVFLPLIQGRRRNTAADEAVRNAAVLQDQLQRLVNAVRDLDFDFDTGKITEADYVTQRKLLIGRGVSTLLRLDEARKNEAVLDSEIEQMVASARKKPAKAR